MAMIFPALPSFDATTVNPATGKAVEGFIPTLAAVPAGATYAGIFEVGCVIEILGGAAAGAYKNTGTTAVPAWTAI